MNDRGSDETFRNGGPAFPTRSIDEYFHGMSLRDWYAGKALLKLDVVDAIEDYLEYLGSEDQTVTKEVRDGAHSMMARNAYEIADAMLEARKAPVPGGKPS